MRSLPKDLADGTLNFAVVTVEEEHRGSFTYKDEAELFAKVLSERYPLSSYEVVRYQEPESEQIFYKNGKKI